MNRIRSLRQRFGLTQADLAERILVSQSSLSGYENGKFEPDSKTLLKIADVFHVSVDYLLGSEHACTAGSATIKIPVYRFVSSRPQKQDTILFHSCEAGVSASQADAYFGLYIDADFMEPRICSGDLIIARRQSEVPNGSIAVIRTGSDKTFVKKVWKLASGELMLLSFNTKYEPVVYTSEQTSSLPVQIIGLVVEFRGRILFH